MKLTIRMMFLFLVVVGLAACGADTDDAATSDAASGEAAATTGAPVDGGLTVPEALETDAEGPLTVKGFLIGDGSSVRLCQVALESYPPQCGGESVEVEGVDVNSLEEAITEGDVTWVEYITLTGDLEGGVLIVTDSTRS